MKPLIRWLRDLLNRWLGEDKSAAQHKYEPRWVEPPDLNEERPKISEPYVADQDLLNFLRDNKSPEAVDKGQAQFRALLDLWVQGFGDSDAAQPDRASYLERISPRSINMLIYVFHRGGLIQAVYDEQIFPESSTSPKESAVHIAANIAQVASIKFPDLSDLYHPVIPWE